MLVVDLRSCTRLSLLSFDVTIFAGEFDFSAWSFVGELGPSSKPLSELLSRSFAKNRCEFDYDFAMIFRL